MYIDPKTKNVTLTAEELANILFQIDCLSETVTDLVDIIKTGPVNYPELDDKENTISFSTNYPNLKISLFDDFELINSPGNN